VIDTHAHLDACDDVPAALLERAQDAGVTRVITIGTGLASCRAALSIADDNPAVFVAVGIDPHRASSEEADQLPEIAQLVDHPRVVAVGETGLDGFHTFAAMADQRRLFERHLALAADSALPVVIHSREAERDTAAALATFSGTVVLHCFSSPGLLDCALERGYYVSYAGNVTFPKAADLRKTVASVPLDRLLAETDAPYLSPVPLRGRANEPSHIVHTVAALAAERGIAPDELAAIIDENASRAFGLG